MKCSSTPSVSQVKYLDGSQGELLFFVVVVVVFFWGGRAHQVLDEVPAQKPRWMVGGWGWKERMLAGSVME